jgi:hypothetical protein
MQIFIANQPAFEDGKMLLKSGNYLVNFRFGICTGIARGNLFTTIAACFTLLVQKGALRGASTLEFPSFNQQ